MLAEATPSPQLAALAPPLMLRDWTGRVRLRGKDCCTGVRGRGTVLHYLLELPVSDRLMNRRGRSTGPRESRGDALT